MKILNSSIEKTNCLITKKETFRKTNMTDMNKQQQTPDLEQSHKESKGVKYVYECSIPPSPPKKILLWTVV